MGIFASKFPFAISKANSRIFLNGEVIREERKNAKNVVNTNAMKAAKKTIFVVSLDVLCNASGLW
ncbi:hypothetical protein D9M73_289780 [compost metagenome]